MSSISSVYDAVLTELSTIFPTKTRIPNAYSLVDNPITFLRDSYGLRMDGAASTQRDFCVFSRVRDFSIILTREVIKTEIQTSQVDTAVKAILEDIYTLQKEFLADDQIGSATNLDIIRAGSFTGLEYFNFEKSNFMTTEVSFSIQISNNY